VKSKIKVVLEKRSISSHDNYRVVQLTNAITIATLEKEFVVGNYLTAKEANELVSLGEYEIIVKISKN
jgi:hypothetical protein